MRATAQRGLVGTRMRSVKARLRKKQKDGFVNGVAVEKLQHKGEGPKIDQSLWYAGVLTRV